MSTDFFGMKMVLYSLLLPKRFPARESLNFGGTKFRYHLKLPKSQITAIRRSRPLACVRPLRSSSHN